MQIDEIIMLHHWVQRKLVKSGLQGKLEALVQKIQKNAQPNQQKESFEEIKTEVSNLLEDVDTNEISIEQLGVLDEFGVSIFLGLSGSKNFKKIFTEYQTDIGEVLEQVKKLNTRINSAVEHLKAMEEAIRPVEHLFSREIVLREGFLVRIYFQEHAAINDVVDFKRWGKSWHDIGRGVAMLHDLSPKDIQIVGASNGSIVLSLIVARIVADSISKIIISALSIAEKYYEVRKKAEEVRALEIDNDARYKLYEQLLDQATKLKDEQIERVLSDIVRDREVNNEISNTLRSSIKNIVDFVQKGGRVDCSVDEDSNEDEDQELVKLREQFSEVRKLENRVRQLEAPLENDNDVEDED